MYPPVRYKLGFSLMRYLVLDQTMGGLVPDGNAIASPEVKSGGWSALKAYASYPRLSTRKTT